MSELHFALVADIYDTAKSDNQQMVQRFMASHPPLLTQHAATIETTGYAATQHWGAR
jgi:hypothetical protein